MKNIRRVTAVLLLVVFLSSQCYSAPVQLASDEKLLDIEIEEIPDSLITAANKKVSSLKDSVADKATAINGLVDVTSGTLTNGYSAISQTLTAGLSAVNGMVSNGVNAVSSQFAPAVESVGRGFTFVSNGFNTGVMSLSDRINDQFVAAGRAVSGGVRAVGDLASEGTALAQNTVTHLGNTVTSLVNQKGSTINNAVEQARGIIPSNPFADRPKKIESAILEQEDILSKANSVKDNLQQVVAEIFQPQPVVDNITEDEKYGNSGDRFATIGKALVGTTEGLASFLSNAVNVPFKLVASVSKTVTEKFNNLGAKLIGL